MITITNKNGKTKFIWKDEDDEPVSVDELIKKEAKEQEAKENDDGN